MDNPKNLHLDKRADLLLVEASKKSSDQLLNEKEVAKLLGVSCAWLQIGRSRGYGPPFVRLAPTLVRYRVDDLRGWLDSRVHRATSEYEHRLVGRAAGVKAAVQPAEPDRPKLRLRAREG